MPDVPIGEHRDTTTARLRHHACPVFANPNVVGQDFAREAWQWLYEHGDLGIKVLHTNLARYLRTIQNYAEIVPADC